MTQRSVPGGKTAKATHGNTNPRRRGLPGKQSMHDNFANLNESQEERDDAFLVRYGWLAIAALAGIAIAHFLSF